MEMWVAEDLDQWLRQHFFSSEQDALRGPMTAVYEEDPRRWWSAGWTAVKEAVMERSSCSW